MMTALQSFQAEWDLFLKSKGLTELEYPQWNNRPLDDKIQLLLNDIRSQPSNPSNQNLLEKCWNVSSNCDTGAKIVGIRNACLKIPGLKTREAEEVVAISCADGPLILPAYYKAALAKDSLFFKTLFESSMKEASGTYTLPNIDTTTLKKLIDIWSGDEQVDAQTASDLIEASHRLELSLPIFVDSLMGAIDTWDPADKDAQNMALSLSEQIHLLGVAEINSALENFLINGYLNVKRSNQEGRALRFLYALKDLNVKNLNLNGKGVENHEIKELLLACPDISSLSLERCRISDEIAPNISELKNLTFLNVNYSYILTDKSLMYFSKLSNLETLEMDNCMITDAAAVELVKLKNLITLNISYCKITSITIKELAKISNLRHLNIFGHEITQTTADELATIKSLKSLTLRCNFTPEIARKLAQLTNLTHLDIHSSTLTEADLEELAKLTELTDLNLSNSILKGNAVEALEKFVNLTNLNMSWCRLNDEVAPDLASLNNLRSLDISMCNFTNASIRYLVLLRNLENLKASGCKFTRVAVIELLNSTQLKHIDLTNCNIYYDWELEILAKKSNAIIKT